MKQKDVDYFEMFASGAEICERAAKALAQMLGSPPDYIEMAQKIHEIEHEGDKLYHKMISHLDRSFITPIDREDILSIFRDIEDTIDAIDEVAIMFDILSVKATRQSALDMVKLIVSSGIALVKATHEFRHFKKSKKLNQYLVELNDIEEQGDELYQRSVKKLFLEEKNVLEVVKWKSILDRMEEVLDAAENAADKMEGVVIKNT